MKSYFSLTLIHFLSAATFLLTSSVCAQELANTAVAKGSSSSAMMPVVQTWGIRLPEQDMVTYRGVVNSDISATGNATSMAYPAPNLAGFLAAVVTHGVLNETTKNRQRSAIETQADALLLPHQEVLKTFRNQELVQNALGQTSIKGSKLFGFSENVDTEWVIETNAVFMITQDESALILDNSIVMYQIGTDRDKAFQTIVRVISAPQKDATLSKVWMIEKGAKLKEESASLFAVSVDIALNERARVNNNAVDIPYKTIRYQQGNIEKMERAQLLVTTCNRLLMKTLRGNLMSVPIRTDNSTDVSGTKCV